MHVIGSRVFSRPVLEPKMSRPRFELRTFCVLDRCDNQLRHRPIAGLYIYMVYVSNRASEDVGPLGNVLMVVNHLKEL